MTTETAEQIETQWVEDERSGKKTGLIAILAILAVIGLVIWLLANRDEAS